MQEYKINVGEVEELQTINNIRALDRIFKVAQSTIVNGEVVVLERKQANGTREKFDTLTTLEDLEAYKKSVYKYL